MVRGLTGEVAGKHGRMTYFLEQPARELDSGTVIPSGMEAFKTLIEGMGISFPGLTDKALKAALVELRGLKLQGYSTGNGGNVIFNNALDVEDVEPDDEDFDEDIGDDDDEEEAPPPKKKPARKKRAKKAEPEPEPEPEDDDDDDDFDFDDL